MKTKTEWYFQEQPAFGPLLRDWMRRTAISPAALAKELGADRQTIYYWQQGRVDPALKFRLALRGLAEKTGV